MVNNYEKAKGESSEWRTPGFIFDALGLDFAVDPCAPQSGFYCAPARTRYTECDDGLRQPWPRGFVRHAGGPKEAWIARVDEPFKQLRSRRWYPGSDPDDPAVPKHHIECFGSLGTRQFGIDGPHTRDRGEVVSTYSFAGGASPANTPREALPVLPKAAYAAACDLFDEIAAAAGLTALKERRNARGEVAARVFELDADTGVETQDYGVMTVAELERLVQARRKQAGASTLRCSGSFHDRTRVRTDSHLINWGRFGLGIWDSMTETTWHRRERAPSATFNFLEQLRGRNPLKELP
jgi:hypothetical protein